MPVFSPPAAVQTLLETIGNTPMVELTRTDTGRCRLFAKLENQNPGGSIKDRIGLSMITDAEARGVLKPGGALIEATAGNTGLGLALVARMKGYRVKLVIPDKMSREKISHLRAMGAEIIMTRSDVGKGHPDYYQDLARRIADETGAWFVNQFENPANPLAHETGTGPEIWRQMEHRVDAVVAGVGSSGTISGLTAFFRKVSPHTGFILADPVGSVLADYVNTGRLRTDAGAWLVEGIGEDFIPAIADFSMTKRAYSITDAESFAAVRDLLKNEGILAGSSSGTLLAAALRYCREQTEEKRVVTLVCDSGAKYLSKMFNDTWMRDRGLMDRAAFGDLRDFVAHPAGEGAVVSVRPDDTLDKVYGLMKLYDISQLPVLDGAGKPVGIIDESDLLHAVYGKNMPFSTRAREVMAVGLVSISCRDSQESLVKILDNGYVAVVEDENGAFLGLVTKIDVISKLYRETAA
ncbi:MAG: pyridoxal-phosphate dependent enzyme [Methylobacteriaceae bacterium]|jgi:cystathionine beta-synthase|nr:pyridoxal-phosphate dependent enzyme [Methylobacteriaceae bacterium]